MKVTKELIDNLATARQSAFPDFDRIKLTRPAVTLLTRLFLNPDCVADIDFRKLATSRPQIKLQDIAQHIITAAPVTIAQYCQDHQKLLVTDQDIIKCFGLDHVDSVLANKVHEVDNPQTALAHILTAGKLKSINKNLGTLEIKLSEDKSVELKNVLIPQDLSVSKGQMVFQHYGVVIDKADDMADQIKLGQKEMDYFQQMLGQNKKKTIDFADKSVFKKDLIGAIIREEIGLDRKSQFKTNKKVPALGGSASGGKVSKKIEFAKNV
ncbi:hypothetical protein KKI23_02880 [Patescibacteria group bacterium]|nr:hypothetical protein [Patescibacteria group bacterium]